MVFLFWNPVTGWTGQFGAWTKSWTKSNAYFRVNLVQGNTLISVFMTQNYNWKINKKDNEKLTKSPKVRFN